MWQREKKAVVFVGISILHEILIYLLFLLYKWWGNFNFTMYCYERQSVS
jgi:hypothetical protein